MLVEALRVLVEPGTGHLFWIGSGSGLIFSQMLDPDPFQMNTDPKHCLSLL